MRSGLRRPNSIATRPPIEWPSTCARSMPSSSSSDSTHVGEERARRRRAGNGLSESPKPGRSMRDHAVRRRRSAATVGRNSRLRRARARGAARAAGPARPRASTAGPSRVCDGAEAQPAGPVRRRWPRGSRRPGAGCAGSPGGRRWNASMPPRTSRGDASARSPRRRSAARRRACRRGPASSSSRAVLDVRVPARPSSRIDEADAGPAGRRVEDRRRRSGRRACAAGQDLGHGLQMVARARRPAHSASARPTESPTQTGFSPPSISTVKRVTICHQPPPISSTDTTSAVARSFEPGSARAPGSAPCSSRS